MNDPERKSLLDMLGILRAYKTTFTTIQSDATVNDDPHLFVSLSAPVPYLVLTWLRCNSDATADIKCTYTYSGTVATGSPWFGLYYMVEGASSTTNRIISAFGGEVSAPTTTGSDGFWLHFGWIETATPGKLQLRWAQTTSQALDTTVYRGAMLWAFPMD